MFLFYLETNNFNNSEIVGRRTLPDLWMSNIFNVLSIISFKRPDFGLKCLVTITPKVQSLKFKANVWIKLANCSSLFELIDSNWVIIMEQKRKTECSSCNVNVLFLTNKKNVVKTINQWEFDCGLFTNLPRMIVVCDFSPSSFKLKRGILPSLTKWVS